MNDETSRKPDMAKDEAELHALRTRYRKISQKFDNINLDTGNFSICRELSSRLLNGYLDATRRVVQQTGENRSSDLDVAGQFLDDLEFYYELLTEKKRWLYPLHKRADSASMLGNSPPHSFIEDLKKAK